MHGEWLYTMDERGLTPIDRALNSGHMAIAEFMLRLEKEDHSNTSSDRTPLHRASYLGLAAAITSLLSYGASPNTRDRHGETPLHKAAREGHAAAVRVLAEVSDANAANCLGMTPLHWAALNGNAEVARVLLAHGADPHIHNECLDGLTPAKLAQIMGYQELSALMSKSECFAA